MKCENCKYFHELRELDKKIYKCKSVCTFFPQTTKGYDAFALIVHKDGSCENWESDEEWQIK